MAPRLIVTIIAWTLSLLVAGGGVPAPAFGDGYGTLPHGDGFRNVRDIGAKGNGVSDDTSAFIRALELERGGKGTREKTPGGIWMDWRAGEKSMLIDTLCIPTSTTQELLWRISGTGGGFFENSWNPGVGRAGAAVRRGGRTGSGAAQLGDLQQPECDHGEAVRLEGGAFASRVARDRGADGLDQEMRVKLQEPGILARCK